MSSNSSPWTATLAPSVTIRTVATTKAAQLYSSLSSAVSASQNETAANELRTLSEIIRGVQASLTIINAEKIIATETNERRLAQATDSIYNASLNLQSLAREKNIYLIDLNILSNIIYFVVFTICFLYTVGMVYKSRYHWYNISFVAGESLQFMGWLGRVMSLGDPTNLNFFLLQYIGLTISPAFLMGGIYFLFAQLVIIHGRQYSVLKPMWYSYLFISADALSLIIQAVGGGTSSSASRNNTDPKPGTDTMIAGIAIQVAFMTLFLGFWFEFLIRLYLKNSLELEGTENGPYIKRSFANFFRFLFNFKLIRKYRETVLESHYNSQYKIIRDRELFPWFPLVMTISVVLIYIRSVYRIFELAQGFKGYLILHEVYLMVLDALMIAVVCILFIPFHPFWVFGSLNFVKLAHIMRKDDEKSTSTSQQESQLTVADA